MMCIRFLRFIALFVLPLTLTITPIYSQEQNVFIYDNPGESSGDLTGTTDFDSTENRNLTIGWNADSTGASDWHIYVRKGFGGMKYLGHTNDGTATRFDWYSGASNLDSNFANGPDFNSAYSFRVVRIDGNLDADDYFDMVMPVGFNLEGGNPVSLAQPEIPNLNPGQIVIYDDILGGNDLAPIGSSGSDTDEAGSRAIQIAWNFDRKASEVNEYHILVSVDGEKFNFLGQTYTSRLNYFWWTPNRLFRTNAEYADGPQDGHTYQFKVILSPLSGERANLISGMLSYSVSQLNAETTQFPTPTLTQPIPDSTLTHTPFSTYTPTPTPIYTPTNTPPIGLSSNWSFLGGEWSIIDGTLKAVSLDNTDPKHAWINLDVGNNYTVEADVRIDAWIDNDDYSRAGVAVRLNPETNNAVNLIFHENMETVEYLNDKLAWSNTNDNAFLWRTGIWYTFHVVVNGNEIQGYVQSLEAPNEEKYHLPRWNFSERDSGFPGLTASSNPGVNVSFDNFRVFVEDQLVYEDKFDGNPILNPFPEITPTKSTTSVPTPTPNAMTNINTEENFPDPNFRAVVEEYMGVSPGGEFTALDAAQKNGSLDCFDKGIASVKGLEYFLNITSFSCGSNTLTELDVSKNKKLIELKCESNHLSSLDLSQNTGLQSLYCSTNKISYLDFSNNECLGSIFCDRNQIESLVLPKNNRIDEINCSYNNLTDIKNLADCNSLIQADVSNNYLDYDDWNDVVDLRNRLGFVPYHKDELNNSDGFSYSPQASFAPYNCDASSVLDEPVTILVTNANDNVNGNVTDVRTLLDDPGADGISFREALIASNRTKGSKHIMFSLDLKGEVISYGSDGYFNPYFLLSGDILINGDVDNDEIADITLDGSHTNALPTGIAIWSNNNTVKNLIVKDYSWAGISINCINPYITREAKNNQVIGNHILYSTKKWDMEGACIEISDNLGGYVAAHKKTDLLIQDTLIQDNYVKNRNTGIIVLGGSLGGSRNTIDNLTIKNNHSIDNMIGIGVLAGDVHNQWYGMNPAMERIYSASNRITNLFISDNIIENGHFFGISVAGGIVADNENSVEHVEICNNTLRSPGGTGIYVYAGAEGDEYIKGGNNRVSGVLIKQNTIHNAVDYGMLLTAGQHHETEFKGTDSNLVENVTIEDNQINIFNTAGIFVSGGWAVRGPDGVQNNAFNTLKILNNQIVNTHKQGEYGVAIKVVGGEYGEGPGQALNNHVSDLTLSNNYIDGNDQGIWIIGGSGENAKNNTVTVTEMVNNTYSNTVGKVQINDNENGATENQVIHPAYVKSDLYCTDDLSSDVPITRDEDPAWDREIIIRWQPQPDSYQDFDVHVSVNGEEGMWLGQVQGNATFFVWKKNAPSEYDIKDPFQDGPQFGNTYTFSVWARNPGTGIGTSAGIVYVEDVDAPTVTHTPTSTPTP